MNADEFNMLNVNQQINYINSRLDEDLTLRDVIERELNLPRSTIRNRFARNKYVYNKRANRYIKNSEVKDTKVKNNVNMSPLKYKSIKNIIESNIDIKHDKIEETQYSNINLTNSNTVMNPLGDRDKNKSNINKKANKLEESPKSNIGIPFSKNNINDDINETQKNKGSNIAMKQLKDENNIDAKLDKLRKKIKDNIDITKNKSNTIELEYKEAAEIFNKSNIDETQENKECNINITKSNMEICSLENSEIIELRKLLKHKDEILDFLVNKPLSKNNDIDVSQLSGNLKVKTLKIYDSVLNEFNKFVKDHKELKQQDIISLALKEFLENHS